MSTSSWLPCIDGVSERCPWQIDITVPKRIRNIFPQKPVAPKRSPHRTRSMALHNGLVFPPPEEPEKTPASNFSQEELDSEMVVVCAGEFIKEVYTIQQTTGLWVAYHEEFAYKDSVVLNSAARWGRSDCIGGWSILENESIRSERI